MKKLLFGLAVALGTLSFAQYQGNGWGNGSYGNGGYGNNDSYHDGYYQDSYYFPDEYYYDYPQDYYADNYYQSYYNDYRNSIMMINWNDFFRMHRLSGWQIQQIMMLNDMYSNYSSWNSYYRYNPDRWYYDRFYSLRQILGPQIFIVFQNNFYRGYNPIEYFQNYRRDYYMPKFRVMPRYRNVNINVYRVDRSRFTEKHGNKYGWNQTRNPHNPGGFKEGDGKRNSGGFKSNSQPTGGSIRNNPSIRSGDSGSPRGASPSTRTPSSNGGLRNSGSETQSGGSGVFQSPRNTVRGSASAPVTPTREVSSVRSGSTYTPRNMGSAPSRTSKTHEISGASGDGNNPVNRSTQRSSSSEAGTNQGTRSPNTGVRGGGLR